MRKIRRFTQAEDEFIRKNIGRLSCSDIAERLGRPAASVVSRATTLGLRQASRKVRRFTKEDDEFIRNSAGKISLQEISERIGRSTGSVWGRGQKLGAWFDRKKRTARPTITSQGYVRIPVEEGNRRRWTLEHIHIVEQNIGRRLRNGEQVHHINLNTTENQLENLYLCRDGVAHNRAHNSLTRLVGELLERGIVCFNRSHGVYELCAKGK